MNCKISSISNAYCVNDVGLFYWMVLSLCGTKFISIEALDLAMHLFWAIFQSSPLVGRCQAMLLIRQRYHRWPSWRLVYVIFRVDAFVKWSVFWSILISARITIPIDDVIIALDLTPIVLSLVYISCCRLCWRLVGGRFLSANCIDMMMCVCACVSQTLFYGCNVCAQTFAFSSSISSENSMFRLLNICKSVEWQTVAGHTFQRLPIV